MAAAARVERGSSLDEKITPQETLRSQETVKANYVALLFIGLIFFSLAAAGVSVCPGIPQPAMFFLGGVGGFALSFIGLVVAYIVKCKMEKSGKSAEVQPQTEKDIPALTPAQWGVINADERLLKERDLNSYMQYLAAQHEEGLVHVASLADYDGTISSLEEQALLINQNTEARYIPFYLNVNGNHWVAVLIDRELRTVEFFDSVNGYNTWWTKIRLRLLARDLSAQSPDEQPFTFVSKMNHAVQFNGYDCGVWTSKFLDERMKDPQVNFNRTIPRFQGGTIAKAYRKNMQVDLEKLNGLRAEAFAEELEMYENATYRGTKADKEFQGTDSVYTYVEDRKNPDAKPFSCGNIKLNADINAMSPIDRIRMLLNGERLEPDSSFDDTKYELSEADADNAKAERLAREAAADAQWQAALGKPNKTKAKILRSFLLRV